MCNYSILSSVYKTCKLHCTLGRLIERISVLWTKMNLWTDGHGKFCKMRSSLPDTILCILLQNETSIIYAVKIHTCKSTV